MGIEFITTVIKSTILFALTVLLISTFYNEIPFGAGFCAGAMWGSLNLYIIKHLLQSWLVRGYRDYLRIYVIAFIKFPLLYLSGYGLLKVSYFPLMSLIGGFSLIFIVIFILGLGYICRKTEAT